MATVASFKELNCWKLARQVAKEIGSLCKQGAFAADNGLRDQIQRASGSVMDNSTEGFDRGSRGEFMQFLGYAKGSAGEVKSQLYRAFDNDFISQDCFTHLLDRFNDTSRTIKGLLLTSTRLPSKANATSGSKSQPPPTTRPRPKAQKFHFLSPARNP